MKKLLIVESPAKIKTISKFLGNDFTIMSTLGHIKDLPSKELGVTMNGEITLDYVVLEKKNKVINDICREAKKAQAIYLAPDPDREGEIIAWHVEQEIEKTNKNKQSIYRITFNEITKPAIEEALKHPSQVDTNKVAAQQARRVLDRWVGYEVSPILWKKVSKGLSAGRVQSVALRLICDREQEIRSFKATEYWSIEGTFTTGTKPFSASLTHIRKKKAEIKNKKESDTLVVDLKKQSYSITSIKDSKRIKNPAAPFMTSTLQQAAYNRLGFSVDKTMTLAQKLYEGIVLNDPSTPVALITYMRTDSLRLSDTALTQARSFIKKSYGQEYLPPKSVIYSKTKAQDAHEAIRPIDATITPDDISNYVESDILKLYTLIWQRFIASQMKPAQYAQRQVVIDGGPYTFKVTGSTLVFDGFLRVYADDEKEEKNGKVILPADLEEKKSVTLEKLNPKQHFTEAPPRYTEASLVKELEKEGIGRPSTYATILKTIRARAYTELDNKKRFVPTELGMVVTKLLIENLPHIMDLKFTAHMEEDLDKIAAGTLKRDRLLKDFYRDFKKALEAFSKDIKKLESTNIPCPECKKGTIVIRFGKTGPFGGCDTYPECTFTTNFTREADGTIKLVSQEAPKLLEEKCPNCGKALRQVMGKFGPFIACSGYPDCKYIHQIKSKFLCPECSKGHLIRRSWKGKVFWGCEKYPSCKFTISGDIEQTQCPTCKSPYLLKRKSKEGESLTCPEGCQTE